MVDDERPEPGANVHLKDYLRLLSRHRWLITTVFAVTAVQLRVSRRGVAL